MSEIHVELLTKAREKIQKRKAFFLCNALDSFSPEAMQIKAHINQLLNGSFTLNGWVCRTVGLSYEPGVSSRKMKATRLAWIDWLIKEWKDAP